MQQIYFNAPGKITSIFKVISELVYNLASVFACFVNYKNLLSTMSTAITIIIISTIIIIVDQLLRQ